MGIFFQPRDVTMLSPQELDDYARICALTVERSRAEFHEIKGELRAISLGVRQDAWWTFSGFALAVISIATTPFFTPAGAGALIGGAGSLAGVKGYLEKSSRRGDLRQRNKAVQRAITFCESELARITDEKRRRGLPPP